MKKLKKFGVVMLRAMYSDRWSRIMIGTGILSIILGIWLGEKPEYINIIQGIILIIMGIWQLISNKRKRRQRSERRSKEQTHNGV